ncbi:NAD(+) diphosphatase [Pedococcus ginsenosidimutans]|uniref:NAD(+) diphosphatase n=1 Tax=Pedococcus ginsenosidimutans TaxID=490570 RepID=A0ABP8Y4L1_9MICO
MGSFAKTLPTLPFAQPGLDRSAELRTDPGLLADLLATPTTRVLELHGDRVAVREEVGARSVEVRLSLRAPEPGDTDRLALFLGVDERDTAYVTVVLDAPEDADGPGGEGTAGLRTLRQVGADLEALDATVFTTSLALANWHRAHPFCPRCGAPTEPAQGGWLRRCTAEGSEHYPRTDVAVIMSVVDQDDRLLLARGAGWGEGRFSVLAGFLEPGESLPVAVAREVREEVGLEVTDVEYLGDQPWPFPTSLMVGFTARAVGVDLVLQDSEIAEARWFTRDELRAAVADGRLAMSGRLSISRRLLEHWLGHEVDAP